MTLGWYAKVAVRAPAIKLVRKLRLSYRVNPQE
jgi:hypothetical protein